MNGEDLDYSSGYQDSYPTHWPETKQRLENVEEFLHQFNQMVDENHWNQRLLGFIAQQAVENTLKGWLSACNDARTFSHELTGLWKDIEGIEDWSNPESGELHRVVTNLFACIQYQDPDRPGEEADWLTKYAVTYRYGRDFSPYDPRPTFGTAQRHKRRPRRYYGQNPHHQRDHNVGPVDGRKQALGIRPESSICLVIE